jgi:NADH-quinone oxidoreductase subunit A
MKAEFSHILVFILAGLALVFTVISIAQMLRKDRPNPEKNSTYESGEESEGESQVAFNVKYFVIAIVFLIFEVEILMLFPWAIVLRDKNMIKTLGSQWTYFALIEMGVFMFLLVLGLAYVWKKGHIAWLNPNKKVDSKAYPISKEAYAQFNERQKP